MVRVVRGTTTKRIKPKSKTRAKALVTFKRFQNQHQQLTTTLREHGIQPGDTKTNYQRKLRRLEQQISEPTPAPDLATNLSRTLLAMNVGLIDTAYETYQNNSTDRNLYAMIALVDLCRGLSGDLKNQSDLNGLLDRIFAEVLDPALANIMSQIAVQYNNLRRMLADGGKLSTAQLVGELERSGRELATLLSEVREQVGVRLRAQLTGGK